MMIDSGEITTKTGEKIKYEITKTDRIYTLTCDGKFYKASDRLIDIHEAYEEIKNTANFLAGLNELTNVLKDLQAGKLSFSDLLKRTAAIK